MNDIKIGDRVVMNNKYHVSEESKSKIWTVRSNPWNCCGTAVVLLEGKSGGYAIDGLDIVDERKADSSWEIVKTGTGCFDYYFRCKHCHGNTPDKAYIVAPDFCPNCGALMDRDGDSR